MARKRQQREDAIGGALGVFFDEVPVESEPESTKRKKGSGKSVTVPVYIRTWVDEAFQEIAAKHESLSRNAAMHYALRYFLEKYQAGEVSFEFEKEMRLKMPG